MNITIRQQNLRTKLLAILMTFAIPMFADAPKENGNKIVLGDVNRDGKVDASDITDITSSILGKKPIPFHTEAADVNKDGFINIADVTAIIRIILSQSSATDSQETLNVVHADGNITEIGLELLPTLTFENNKVLIKCENSDINYDFNDILLICYSNKDIGEGSNTLSGDGSTQSSSQNTKVPEDKNTPMMDVNYKDNSVVTIERSIVNSISYTYGKLEETSSSEDGYIQTIHTDEQDYPDLVSNVESIVFWFAKDEGSDDPWPRMWVIGEKATDVSRVSATINAQASSLTGVEEYGFLFYEPNREKRIISNLLSSEGNPLPVKCDGSYFKATLTDLQPGSYYRYSPFVKKNGKTYQGLSRIFHTKDVLVSTLIISKDTKDKLRGQVTNGLEELEEAQLGILFWDHSPTSIDDAAITIAVWDDSKGAPEGCFKIDMPSGLESEKWYWYQAFVILNDKVSFGGVASFKTDKQDKIKIACKEVSISNNTYATLTGIIKGVDLSSTDGKVGFQIDTNPDFLEGSRATFTLGNISDFLSGEFSDVYQGFHKGVLYYYRAFMTIGNDVYYSVPQSFMLSVDISERIRTEPVRMDEEMMFNTVYLSFSVADVNDFNNRTAIGFFYNKTGNPNASNASYVEFNDDTWYTGNSLEGTGTLKLNDAMEGNTRYYVRAYLIINGELLYGNEISFVTLPHIGPTRGQVVDLGLSVKWAGWNIGANSPEEIGDYYAWGETEPKKSYSILNYEFYKGWPSPVLKKIDGDITDISGTKYDVARMKWGAPWRMPTKAEIIELTTKCTIVDLYEYKKQLGYLFIGPNGNSIFLPNSGEMLEDTNCDLDIYYRSSTLCKEVDENDKVWGWGRVYVLRGNPGTDVDSPVKVVTTTSWSEGDAVRAVCQ